MFSDNSNAARTDETNNADGYNSAPMVSIKKKVQLSLHRIKDFNAPGSFYKF